MMNSTGDGDKAVYAYAVEDFLYLRQTERRVTTRTVRREPDRALTGFAQRGGWCAMARWDCGP
jgi:hypothetical protein